MIILRTVSAQINKAIEVLLFGLGFSMAVLVAVQVFCRYVLNQSLFWSEELARYLLVWLTFLGASCAYYRHAHPGVDILYNRVPAALRRGFSLITHAVSIGLFAVMIFYGWQFAHFVRLQTTPALQLPKWLLIGIIPVSGAILMIHGLSFLIEALKGDRHDG